MVRNQVAAVVAFASGVLFLVSGYRANIALYNLIEKGLVTYTAKDFWQFAIIPLGILALIAQLGGIAVIAGAILFAKNHVTSGKILVMIGTGQGLVTIAVSLVFGIATHGLSAANNYIDWLVSSAIGLGVVFSILAKFVAKGSKG